MAFLVVRTHLPELHVCLRPSATPPERPEMSPLAPEKSLIAPNYFSEITSLCRFGDRPELWGKHGITLRSTAVVVER
jgi:hypothetical protein